MWKFIRFSATAAITFFSIGNAFSLSATLNCKTDATAAINKVNAGYKVTAYNQHFFELTILNDTLENTSVSRVLLWHAQCKNGGTDESQTLKADEESMNIYCTTATGAQLLFSLKSLKGAISNFDLVMHPTYGSGMFISAFSCLPK